MPVVNFSQVSRLFAERGSDRTSTDGSNLAAESAGAEAQNIAPQPTGLDKFVSNQGRNFRAGAALSLIHI